MNFLRFSNSTSFVSELGRGDYVSGQDIDVGDLVFIMPGVKNHFDFFAL